MHEHSSRKAYPSDLSDAHWEILEPLLPAPDPEGRPLVSARREIVNALLYVLRTGCSWRQLPHDLPPWQTVYWYLQRWQKDGTRASPAARLAATSAPAGGARPRTQCSDHREPQHPNQSCPRHRSWLRRLEKNR
jgi:putative transposase